MVTNSKKDILVGHGAGPLGTEAVLLFANGARANERMSYDCDRCCVIAFPLHVGDPGSVYISLLSISFMWNKNGKIKLQPTPIL